MEITGTTISGNRANRAGGGIEATADSSTTLLNVALNQNNVGVSPATAAPGNGGGLHITGNGSAEITGGTVNGNVAASEGGGLWNGSGTMTVDGTVIDGNAASGDDADNGGGGIFNVGGTLVVSDATIQNNVADGASAAFSMLGPRRSTIQPSQVTPPIVPVAVWKPSADRALLSSVDRWKTTWLAQADRPRPAMVVRFTSQTMDLLT